MYLAIVEVVSIEIRWHKRHLWGKKELGVLSKKTVSFETFRESQGKNLLKQKIIKFTKQKSKKEHFKKFTKQNKNQKNQNKKYCTYFFYLIF